MVEIIPLGPRHRESVDHLVGLAMQLAAAGRRAEAYPKFARALAIDPNHVGALVNYAAALLADCQVPGGNGPGTAEAMAMTHRALTLSVPHGRDRAVLLNNVAYEMLTRRAFAKAIDVFTEALAEDPAYSQAYNSRGTCYANLGDWDKAVADYERAAANASGKVEPLFNVGIAQLLRGDWENGFKGYELRPLRSPQERYPFTCPRWRGENPNGSRILVYPDMGLGDTINFHRFNHTLAERGAHVFLATFAEAREVLPDLPGVEFIPHTARLENIDYHVPLMSLPGLLGIRPETVPPPVGLRHNGITYYHGNDTPVPKDCWSIGFCSSGNPSHGYDDLRSMPAAKLRAALSIGDVELYDLNRDTEDFDFSKDLTELVSAVWHMDLVVTVDTLVAHVAGELGVPVWNLITCGGAQDWRWLLGREDTVWYPSMRLYRQETIGEWGPVLARVREDLQELT